MRTADYKQIDTQVITNTVMVDDYNEHGEIIGQHEETITKSVPVMGLVYRDMTPQEEAEVLKAQAEAEAAEANREPTLEEKVDALLRYQGLTVKRIGNGVFEVVKPQMGSGDYTNPILYEAGDVVAEGNFYYTETVGKDLPHEAIKSGIPTNFFDMEYFDWYRL